MDELWNDIQSAAERAVSMSQSRPGGTLDYSISSFALIEAMLAEANPYVADLDEAHIEGIVSAFGSYLLEAARRTIGGTYQWLANRQQPVLVVGEPAGHVALATWDKVRGRLMGDVGDNIPFHMSGFLDRARQAQPGERVLFI